jgi:putative addiction module component (TIGR02574 family)
MAMELTNQAKCLSIPDRIRLVEEIWDTIVEENESFELSDTQKRELDRRLELSQKDPSRGRTWEEIKAEFMNSRSSLRLASMRFRWLPCFILAAIPEY